jgi:uncharacterized lipoprotein YddW (UPF0748 family)
MLSGRQRWRHRRPANPLVFAGAASVLALALMVGLLSAILIRREPTLSAAAPDSPVGVCGDLPTHATRDLRGMMLTTVWNIDFPSQPGLDEEAVKAQYGAWLDVAQRQHHNAIFVQIRPNGDAFWPSHYAQWSEWLVGGRTSADPGWDPLEFMVAQTHARGLEFHAWFNPYSASKAAPEGAGQDINQLAPGHILRQHPDWAVTYPVGTADSKLYFDPGNPDVRRYIEDSMLEAVADYDIDGVVFDDFFYPYPGSAGQEFNDAASYARWGNGASLADWRRANVDALIQEMSQRIKALKPWVKFGMNPFGIWRNASNGPVDGVTGSATRGLSAYDAIYTDTLMWVKEQWIDYIAPQLYWYIGFADADYAELVRWWSQQVAGTRVQLYTGQADYRIGQAGPWSTGELSRQFALNRDYAVSGSLHYTGTAIRDDPLGQVTADRDEFYAHPALPPVMSQLPAAPPAAPTIDSSTLDGSGAVTLTWRGSGATSYGIYRYGPTDVEAELVATVRAAGDQQSFVDTPAGEGPFGYCVSGLDRSWNEGPASAAAVAAR